jgi:hypothetical protein
VQDDEFLGNDEVRRSISEIEETAGASEDIESTDNEV